MMLWYKSNRNMRTESYKDKSRTERYYNMDIIRLFCEFKLFLHNGFVIFIAFCFFSNLLCAQTVWTKEDSIHLSKILESEKPIIISNDLKNELERSFNCEPVMENRSSWNDFILYIKSYDLIMPKYLSINMEHIFKEHSTIKLFNFKNEYLKHNKFTIDSNIDSNSYLKYLQRNTQLTYPLNGKLQFNMSGSYTRDRTQSPILPINPAPYTLVVGLSFKLRNNIEIGPQISYQYNIIQKRWEWIGGIKCTILF